MSTYRIYLHTGASSVIEVEADDLEAAIEEAFNEAPTLCAQCSGWGQRAGVELGDWDVDDKYHEVDGTGVEGN